MEESYLTSQAIGQALQAIGLHPYVKDLSVYGIYRGENDYEVFTERLPEIYIQKTISHDLFYWRDDKWILLCAMNQFNSKPFPVRAVLGHDTVVFALTIEIVSIKHFSERIAVWLAQIDEAFDLFEQICTNVALDREHDDLYNVKAQLSDSDNPRIKEQNSSLSMSERVPIDLQDNVKLTLEQLSFKHRIIDKNTFIISNHKRQYTVFLENLPEVRIESKEPLGYFEWHDSIEFAKTAAYFVSDTPCLASARVDDHNKTVLFCKKFTAETGWWSLGAQIYRSLDDIDQSVEAFRDACSVDEDLYKLRLEELLEQGLIKEAKNEPQEDTPDYP